LAFALATRRRRFCSVRARASVVRFACPVLERFAGRFTARAVFGVRFAGRAATFFAPRAARDGLVERVAGRFVDLFAGTVFAGIVFAGLLDSLAVAGFDARDFLGCLARRGRRVVTAARRGAVPFSRVGRAPAVRRARTRGACFAEARAAGRLAVAVFATRFFARRAFVFDPGREVLPRDEVADFDSDAFTERLFGGDGLRRTPCLRPPRCRGGSRSRGRCPGLFLGFPEASTLITTRAALNEKTGCILSGLRS
jgi:hypothetical protein